MGVWVRIDEVVGWVLAPGEMAGYGFCDEWQAKA